MKIEKIMKKNGIFIKLITYEKIDLKKNDSGECK